MQTWYFRSWKKGKKGQVEKCNKREYCAQHNKDVDHQDMNIYCATNQFPELYFLVPTENHMVYAG